MTSNLTSVNDRVILVTGAARSGKSEWAEKLALQTQQAVVYIATSIRSADDPEWQQRILLHQQRRPNSWQIIEETQYLTPIINRALPSQCLLIDSLGTWVANCLNWAEPLWQQTTQTLLTNMSKTQAQLIFVAEETGWGVVPAYPDGRLFRDRLGILTRNIGTIADTTYLVTGGHALNLSLLGTPLNFA